MAQGDGASDAPHGGADGPVRPERPSVTGQAPAPIAGSAAVPAAVRRTVTAWQASLALTGFAIITMVLSRAGIARNLREQLMLRDPTIDPAALDTAAPRVVTGAIVSLVLVALIEWALVRAFTGRRAWARFAFLPVVAVHGVVATLASILVPTSVWQGWLLLLTLLLGLLLAVAGAVLSFLPGVSAWRRSASTDPA